MRLKHAGCVFVLLALAGRAHADARTADILMRECQGHFNSMEYDLAMAKCEAALKADPTVVGAMRYLTVIERALGKKTGDPEHYRKCIAWAEMYLRERPTSRFVDRIRDEINACRKALGERALPKVETQGETGALVVTCDVDGANVTIDDMRRGATPLNPSQVSPGQHVVTVYKFGYIPVTTTVDVITKQIHEVKVSLVRDPNARIEPASRSATEGGPAILEHGVVKLETGVASYRVLVDGKVQSVTANGSFEYEPGLHVVRVEADGYDPWERRVAVIRGQAREIKLSLRTVEDHARDRRWAWALTATAAVTAGVGAYFGLAEIASFDHARDLYEQAERGLVTEDTRTRINDYHSDGDRQKIIATVSFGVSLAALAGAAYFWIRERGDSRPRGETPDLVIAPAPLRAGAGVLLTREFGRR